MSTIVDVSIVICAYTEQRWEWLLDAVASVRSQRVCPREIIVVVDYNPSLMARLRAMSDLPAIRVTENHESRGLSGARNSGIAAARGEIVAFLDDDEIATPDWLARLHRGYTDPAVAGVGGAIQPVWEAGRPAWFPPEFDWVIGCTYRGMPTHLAPVRNLLGGNMSFRREAFAEVGGFSNGIGRIGTRPLGCEETEFCIRLRQRWPGTVLLFDPRAVVLGRVPFSRARWDYFRARCYAEGLSKALVTDHVGTTDGLSTERRYTTRTLPRGVARGLFDAARGDLAGCARAGAIVCGTLVTTGGYATGKLSAWRGARAAGRQP